MYSAIHVNRLIVRGARPSRKSKRENILSIVSFIRETRDISYASDATSSGFPIDMSGVLERVVVGGGGHNTGELSTHYGMRGFVIKTK